MNFKILSLLATFLVIFSCTIIMLEAEESDAATYGTADNPVSSVNTTIYDITVNYQQTIYAYVGSSITLTTGNTFQSTGVTSGYGLSENNGNVSGVLTDQGTIYVNYQREMAGGAISYGSITIYSIATSYNISIYVRDPSGGTATITDGTDPSNTASTSTTTPQSISITQGSSVSLSATLNTGYNFTMWYDETNNSILSTNRTYSFTPSGSMTLSAIYSAGYSMTSNVITGSGSVYITDGTNSSNTSTTSTIVSLQHVTSGTTITYVATPSTGYEFSGWYDSSDNLISSNASYSFTSTAAKYLGAKFTLTSFTVTFNVSPNGAGTLSLYTISDVPSGSSWLYGNNGTSLGVISSVSGSVLGRSVPTANAGYEFVRWSGMSSTITGDITVTAEFTPISTYSISIYVRDPSGGTATITDGTDPSNTASTSTTTPQSISITQGSSVSLSATLNTGYNFTMWYDETNNSILSTNRTYSFTPSGSMTLSAIYSAGYSMTSNVITGSGSVYITDGTNSSNTSTTSTIVSLQHVTSGTTITYVATPSTGYEFSGWYDSSDNLISSNASYSFTSTAAKYLGAKFIRESDPMVYWSNDHYIGKINLLFRFQPTDNMAHIMEMNLYSGTVASNTTFWEDTGYSLKIELSYAPATIKTTLMYNDAEVGSPVFKNLGNWPSFQVTIDSENGKVVVCPVRSIDNFTSFTLYENQSLTVFDFSIIKDTAIYVIKHSDIGNGINQTKFSVVSTDVFLDTYGAVMNNPSINIYDYFPQYDKVRLNFYSFALYGTSITINGTTYPLDGAYVTVQYVNDLNGDHYLPSYFPEQAVKTKKLELTNIYVTWDGSRVSLTFVNDRFTIDLGAYTEYQEIVSFQGLWYFSSMVYEPYSATEKQLGDWKDLPEVDKNTMLLIFLGFLLLIGAFAYIHVRRSDGGYVDLIIIGCAALVAFIMLGV